jgi:Acyl-CoA thioesterase C-terminal domain/Acyl-CoA thioesterase N-terminal domain
MLHGRLLAGLVARAVEGAGDDPALRVVRLTVDMFRSPPMSALHVATRVVRDGRRVRVVDVSIRSTDVELARASALLLRTGPHPGGMMWRAPEWDAPLPDTLPSPDDGGSLGGWDVRLLTPGGFWTSARKRLWSRDRWQLVAGEEPSPVVRAALAADLPNPLANSSSEGLQFINADLTLFLSRPPRSEWIGLEVADHLGHDGVAVGTCTLYDTSGAIGWSSVCAIANTATLRE